MHTITGENTTFNHEDVLLALAVLRRAGLQSDPALLFDCYQALGPLSGILHLIADPNFDFPQWLLAYIPHNVFKRDNHHANFALGTAYFHDVKAKLDMTQEEFARVLGVSKTYAKSILAGDVSDTWTHFNTLKLAFPAFDERYLLAFLQARGVILRSR